MMLHVGDALISHGGRGRCWGSLASPMGVIGEQPVADRRLPSVVRQPLNVPYRADRKLTRERGCTRARSKTAGCVLGCGGVAMPRVRPVPKRAVVA